MAKFKYTKEVLIKVYSYYKKCGSLQQTSNWCQNSLGIPKTNRHRLSKLFRQQGWTVKPPNGRPDLYKGHIGYRSPEIKFISFFIESVIKDIKNYKKGKECFINYISACWFIYSPMWDKYINVLSNQDSRLHPNMSIIGVSPKEISFGRDCYKRCFKKLVYYEEKD